MDENTTPAMGTTMWGKLSWMILKNNEMDGAVPDGEGEVAEKRVISNSWRQRGEKEDVLRKKRKAQQVVSIEVSNDECTEVYILYSTPL